MDKKKGCCGLSSSRGFTLIELLVVIAIIGILASIVLVSLNTARSKGRDTQRVATVKQIQTALEMYFDSAGRYPGTIAGLVPTYLSATPADPQTGSYQYCIDTSGTKYHVGTKAATLENSTNTVLNADADKTATTDGCVSGGFDGTDPIYDMVP